MANITIYQNKIGSTPVPPPEIQLDWNTGEILNKDYKVDDNVTKGLILKSDGGGNTSMRFYTLNDNSDAQDQMRDMYDIRLEDYAQWITIMNFMYAKYIQDYFDALQSIGYVNSYTVKVPSYSIYTPTYTIPSLYSFCKNNFPIQKATLKKQFSQDDNSYTIQQYAYNYNGTFQVGCEMNFYKFTAPEFLTKFSDDNDVLAISVDSVSVYEYANSSDLPYLNAWAPKLPKWICKYSDIEPYLDIQ